MRHVGLQHAARAMDSRPVQEGTRATCGVHLRHQAVQQQQTNQFPNVFCGKQAGFTELVQTDGQPLPGEMLPLSGLTPGPIAALAGNLVWAPNGTAGGNVYTTWATLAPVIAALEGQKLVTVDNSGGALSAHITTGNWAGIEDVTFIAGINSGVVDGITIDDGAHFTYPAGAAPRLAFDGIALTVASTTAAFIALTGTQILNVFFRNLATLVTSGTKAFCDVGGAGMIAWFTGNSLLESGTAGAFNCSNAAATLDFFIITSTMQTSTVSATAAGTLSIGMDGASFVSTFQAIAPSIQVFNSSLGPAPGQPQNPVTTQPAYNPVWFAQTDIYWDPVAGLDTASGTVGNPVKTFAEIVRRYGSSSPQLPYGQSVTVHQLTGQTAGVDPVFFEPLLSGGGQAVLVGTLVANGATFSPATVTAKNRATPQLLVLNTVPGGVVAKNLIQNTTSALKGWAFVDSVAGGNATMSQPVANSTITTAGIPTLTEDNAWANTDTYQAYTLPLCNLKAWSPIGGDVTSAACAGWVQWVQLVDSSGSAASEFPLVNKGCAVVALSACQLPGRLQMGGLSGRSVAIAAIGCDITGNVTVYAGSAEVYAGICRGQYGPQAAGSTLDGDAIVLGTMVVNGLVVVGAAYVAGNVNITEGIVATSTALWGPGNVAVFPGGVYYNNSGTTFAASLLITGTLKLGTLTTGTPPSNSGTFVANGTTAVNVAPGGGGHFPANAKIALSMNAVGGTPVGLPYFSANQTADQFTVKAASTDTSTYNFIAFGGSVNLTVANMDTYNGLYDEATGARFSNPA